MDRVHRGWHIGHREGKDFVLGGQVLWVSGSPSCGVRGWAGYVGQEDPAGPLQDLPGSRGTSCHQPGEPLSLHYGKGPHLSHPTVSERGLLYYEDLMVYMYVPV